MKTISTQVFDEFPAHNLSGLAPENRRWKNMLRRPPGGERGRGVHSLHWPLHEKCGQAPSMVVIISHCPTAVVRPVMDLSRSRQCLGEYTKLQHLRSLAHMFMITSQHWWIFSRSRGNGSEVKTIALNYSCFGTSMSMLKHQLCICVW
jgi:hypothetical protein